MTRDYWVKTDYQHFYKYDYEGYLSKFQVIKIVFLYRLRDEKIWACQVVFGVDSTQQELKSILN